MVIKTSVTFVRGLAGLLLLHLHHGLGGDGGQLVPRHVVDRALHAAAGHAVALVHQDHCSTHQLQGALQSIGGNLRRFVSDKATVKRAAMKQPTLRQRLIVAKLQYFVQLSISSQSAWWSFHLKRNQPGA